MSQSTTQLFSIPTVFLGRFDPVLMTARTEHVSGKTAPHHTHTQELKSEKTKINIYITDVEAECKILCVIL